MAADNDEFLLQYVQEDETNPGNEATGDYQPIQTSQEFEMDTTMISNAQPVGSEDQSSQLLQDLVSQSPLANIWMDDTPSEHMDSREQPLGSNIDPLSTSTFLDGQNLKGNEYDKESEGLPSENKQELPQVSSPQQQLSDRQKTKKGSTIDRKSSKQEGRTRASSQSQSKPTSVTPTHHSLTRSRRAPKRFADEIDLELEKKNFQNEEDDESGGSSSDEDPDRLYCFCRMPYDKQDPKMVQCDRCREWYHLSCLDMTMEYAESLPKFICSPCESEIIIEGQNAALSARDIRQRREELRAASRRRSNRFNNHNREDLNEDDQPISKKIKKDSTKSEGSKPLIDKKSQQSKKRSRRDAKSRSASSDDEPTPRPNDDLDETSSELVRPPGLDDGTWAIMKAEKIMHLIMGSSGTTRTSSSSSSSSPASKSLPSSKHEAKKTAVEKPAKILSYQEDSKNGGAQAIRSVVVQTLADALEQHWPENKAPAAASNPMELAEAIEAAMFEHTLEIKHGQRVCGQDYKAKYRSLLYNIKDNKNDKLRARIFDGDLNTDTLVRMSPEEYANDELAAWRAEEQKRLTRESLLAKGATINDESLRILRTSKGEFLVAPSPAPVLVPASLPAPEPEVAPSTTANADGDLNETIAADSADLSSNSSATSMATSESTSLPTTVVKQDFDSSLQPQNDVITPRFANEKVEAVPTFEDFEAVAPPAPPKFHTGRSKTDNHVSSKPRTAVASAPATSSSKQPLLEVVFNTSLKMDGLSQLYVNAHCIDGRGTPDGGWASLFGDASGNNFSLQISGRIEREKAESYLNKVHTVSGHKELRVLRFVPTSIDDETAYVRMGEYFLSRGRFGVLSSVMRLHPSIKDFYLVPVPQEAPYPSFVSASRFRHLSQLLDARAASHQSSSSVVLLGVIVRATTKSATGADSTTPEYNGSPNIRSNVDALTSADKRNAPPPPPPPSSLPPPSTAAPTFVPAPWTVPVSATAYEGSNTSEATSNFSSRPSYASYNNTQPWPPTVPPLSQSYSQRSTGSAVAADDDKTTRWGSSTLTNDERKAIALSQSSWNQQEKPNRFSSTNGSSSWSNNVPSSSYANTYGQTGFAAGYPLQSYQGASQPPNNLRDNHFHEDRYNSDQQPVNNAARSRDSYQRYEQRDVSNRNDANYQGTPLWSRNQTQPSNDQASRRATDRR